MIELDLDERSPAGAPTLHQRLRRLVESQVFQRVVLAVIVLNAITLGLETSKEAMAVAGPLLVALDRAALAVFVLELALKLYVYRLGFFRDGWNVFDFIIVAVALVPSNGALSVLRALRILRALRLVSGISSMRKVVYGLFQAIPGMTSIIALLALVFYISSVIATKLYAQAFPEWFGTLGKSAYSLFQIMTLESWSMGIVRPVMEVYPFSWLFFVTFILLTSFTVLNLFIAVIVNAMQSQHEADVREAENTAHDERARLLEEMSNIRSDIARLEAVLNDRADTPRRD